MRTTPGIDALFPKTRQGILSATYLDPLRWWYMRELARRLRVAPSSLQRELDSLVEGGILRKRREGKHVYFRAATDSPLFEDLHGLVLKTVGLADVLRNALRPFRNRIQWAFVYGSVAKSEERSASDVDLLLVGRVGLADLSTPLRRAERKLTRPVNPTIYTPEELANRLRSKNHFATTVLRSKKIFVLGNAREFDETFGR